MTDQPYNPLDLPNLGESIVRAFLDQPCLPLPPEETFSGAGLYALYYQGEFPAYAPLSSDSCDVPIYVGKAELPGRRVGSEGLQVRQSRALFSRLSKHERSVRDAENLTVDDFRCRYLLVDAIWVALGESLLIRSFMPLWNSGIDGFGINEPGKNRWGGDRSEWDELHPGRPWYEHMVPARTSQDVEEKIARYFEAGPFGSSG